MPDEVRVDHTVPEDDWEELVEFINDSLGLAVDGWSERGKTFYAERIVNLALDKVREEKKHKEEVAEQFHSIEKRIKEVLNS